MIFHFSFVLFFFFLLFFGKEMEKECLVEWPGEKQESMKSHKLEMFSFSSLLLKTSQLNHKNC